MGRDPRKNLSTTISHSLRLTDFNSHRKFEPGCFGNSFFEGEGPWRTLFYFTNGTARGVGAYMLVRASHLSFYVLWLGTSLESVSWVFFVIGSNAPAFLVGVVAFASVWALISGLVNLRKRNAAVTRAVQRERENASAYDRAWAKMRCKEGFDEDVLRLTSNWNTIMHKVAEHKVPKYQDCANPEELFQAADAINPLFQAKVKQLSQLVNGRLIQANVKSETRALEKVFRVYSGGFRKLADLVRTTMVFSGPDAVSSMSKCLSIIASDPDLELIYVQDEKCRVNIEKLVKSGYRDIQLCLRLKSPTAKSLGLDKHFCEMQLQLQDLFALKTASGHKSYITCRNLRGN